MRSAPGARWKAEQFGLGFIREINERGFREISEGDKTVRGAGFYESPYDARPWRSTRSAPERRSAASLISVEDGGAGAEDSTNARHAVRRQRSRPRSDLKQQAFLLVYVLLGTLSVLNLCTTIACEQEAARGHAELGAARLAAAGTILASLSVFFAAHVILMLATVVHRTPSLHLRLPALVHAIRRAPLLRRRGDAVRGGAGALRGWVGSSPEDKLRQRQMAAAAAAAAIRPARDDHSIGVGPNWRSPSSRTSRGQGKELVRTVIGPDLDDVCRRERQPAAALGARAGRIVLLLERVFALEKCPGRELRLQLVAARVRQRQVQVWFQNKRQRTKVGAKPTVAEALAHAVVDAEQRAQAQSAEMLMCMAGGVAPELVGPLGTTPGAPSSAPPPQFGAGGPRPPATPRRPPRPAAAVGGARAAPGGGPGGGGSSPTPSPKRRFDDMDMGGGDMDATAAADDDDAPLAYPPPTPPEPAAPAAPAVPASARDARGVSRRRTGAAAGGAGRLDAGVHGRPRAVDPQRPAGMGWLRG